MDSSVSIDTLLLTLVSEACPSRVALFERTVNSIRTRTPISLTVSLSTSSKTFAIRTYGSAGITLIASAGERSGALCFSKSSGGTISSYIFRYLCARNAYVHGSVLCSRLTFLLQIVVSMLCPVHATRYNNVLIRISFAAKSTTKCTPRFVWGVLQIGRNYAKHALEMGAETPSEPFWFFKPSTSYLRTTSARPVELPPGAEVHHEVELAAVIGKRARNVSAETAMTYVAGYMCAVDLTARNWQAKAKAKGHPWSRAKGCDTFLPLSEFIPAHELPPPNPDSGAIDMRLWLSVNGNVRQDGNTADMSFHLPQLIEHVSRYVTLEQWDILLTGTPDGVGALRCGDVVTAGFGDVTRMEFTCKQL